MMHLMNAIPSNMSYKLCVNVCVCLCAFVCAFDYVFACVGVCLVENAPAMVWEKRVPGDNGELCDQWDGNPPRCHPSPHPRPDYQE